jgi:hypothetical protein
MQVEDKTSQFIPVNVVTVHEGSQNLNAFLISALDFRVGRFILRERAPGTGWIGGWVNLIMGLDTPRKRKIFLPCRESNHAVLVVQRAD